MAKYPLVWVTLDGLNLNIQSTKDDKVQSIYYNGWMHGHCSSSVLIFGIDGLIRICSAMSMRNRRQFLMQGGGGFSVPCC